MNLPSIINVELLFYGILFISIVLGIEGAFLWWRETYGVKQRVSKRMALIEKGASTEEILAELRRETTDFSKALLPSVLRYLDSRLDQAGIRMGAERVLGIMAAITMLVGFIFPLLGGITGQLQSPGATLLVVLFACSIGLVFPVLVINYMGARRLKKIEEQFPTALDVLTRGLRAGYPITGAMELVVSELPDPLSSELGLVLAEMNYGYPLRDALANLAARVQTQDISMFVVSVAIQTETGGNLADILDGLARVIRDRASMVLKVRALASEGKMTGVMLSGLPVLTFCSVFVATPRFYLDVVDDPIFLPATLGVCFLYVTGVVIMRRLIAIKV